MAVSPEKKTSHDLYGGFGLAGTPGSSHISGMSSSSSLSRATERPSGDFSGLSIGFGDASGASLSIDSAVPVMSWTDTSLKKPSWVGVMGSSAKGSESGLDRVSGHKEKKIVSL